MAEDMNNNNNNENGAENNQQQENTPKTVGRGFEAFFPCQIAADKLSAAIFVASSWPRGASFILITLGCALLCH